MENAFKEAKNREFIDCLLIIRNEYLIAERYFNGYNKTIPHNVKSVSKSFLSALIGIALKEKFLDSLNQKIIDFFPEYLESDIDIMIKDITIKHLLTMQAGFDDDYNAYSEIYNSINWIETTLKSILLYSPGDSFSYSTFGTHLLSAILTKATGMSMLTFADEYLFQALKITCKNWEKDTYY